MVLPLIFIVTIVIVATSGCIMPRETANATPNLTAVAGGPSIPSPPTDRSNLNVLRNEPFTINGSVDNLSITKVQVWILDGNISTIIIPVNSDGTFQVTLDPSITAALSRNFTSALVVQYPSPPDQFTVMQNETTGEVTNTGSSSANALLAHVEDTGSYPTTQEDYLERGIEASGNNATIYFLNGIDAWITIDPISPTQPGSLVVSGNTSLPAGTPLSISAATVFEHPTPKNYDSSHEFAGGTAVVTSGTGGSNQYSGTINTSLLNTGRYNILVASENDSWQANAMSTVDLIAQVTGSPGKGNYIDWSKLSLPNLTVNASISPVMLDGAWEIVPPGTQTQNNEVPYGSIIDCTPDAVCRVYTSVGVEVLAVYNSNEEHGMGVPSGAMIDGSIGNVTLIKLNGNVILTKINEDPGES